MPYRAEVAHVTRIAANVGDHAGTGALPALAMERVMSDKQMALDLIEAARQGYRGLLRHPPKDDDDYRERKGKADWQLDAADTIMRGIGSDYRAVVDAFSKANRQIEIMDGQIGRSGSAAEECLAATEFGSPPWMEEDDPGEGDEAPEDVPEAGERAEMYSTLFHDEFDDDAARGEDAARPTASEPIIRIEGPRP